MPEIATSLDCLVRISNTNDPNNYDTSDDVFTVLEYWWLYPDCWDYATQCHGDCDGDDYVDTVDWPTFRDGFSSSYPEPRYVLFSCADHDRDGDIDTIDWPHFRDNFGEIPEADCMPGDMNYVFGP